MFRAVRDAAISGGCTFTTDDPEGYFAWPLVSLPRILASRRIPYRRTRTAFAALEAARPGFFKTSDAEAIEPQVNAVLHEAAHCVADRLWEDAAPIPVGLSKTHATVLRYALGEAFANASELSAMAFVPSPEAAWLLAFNSYWAHLPPMPPAWKALKRAIGAEATATWLLLCFLTSNLCRERLTAPLRRQLLALASIDAGATKAHAVAQALDYLAAEALNLNINFRRHTSRIFFASLGLAPDIGKLTGFDFGVAIQETPALKALIDRLAAVLAH